jgi:hypothetical protein
VFAVQKERQSAQPSQILEISFVMNSNQARGNVRFLKDARTCWGVEEEAKNFCSSRLRFHSPQTRFVFLSPGTKSPSLKLCKLNGIRSVVVAK